MNADGSTQARLTTGGEGLVIFAISPDGQKIAIAAFDPYSVDLASMTAVQTIYVMNADGSHLTSLTDIATDNSSPDWSR